MVMIYLITQIPCFYQTAGNHSNHFRLKAKTLSASVGDLSGWYGLLLIKSSITVALRPNRDLLFVFVKCLGCSTTMYKDVSLPKYSV